MPLFDKGLKNYLKDRFGPDWSVILGIENDILSREKKKPGPGSTFEVRYLGLDGGCHSFQVDRDIPCPVDPGTWRYTYRVMPIIPYHVVSVEFKIL